MPRRDETALGITQRPSADRDVWVGTDGKARDRSGTEIPSLVSGAGNAAVVTIAAPDGYDVGDVLTATPSTGWTVTGYQWTRDGVDIAGATSSTYTLVSADGGKLIGCRAVDAVYSAFATIPSYAPTFPAGYLSLDSSVLTLDSSVLSLV